MIDIFTIFSKGGLVLVWYIQSGVKITAIPVNAVIKSIIETNVSSVVYNHQRLSLKYEVDNENSLVYVVGYQSVLELGYMDKFLTEIALEFRDKYKNELDEKNLLSDFSAFNSNIDVTFERIKNQSFVKRKKEMQSFHESYKSSKTVDSITTLGEKNKNKQKNGKNIKLVKPVEEEEEEVVEPQIEIAPQVESIEESAQERAARILKNKKKRGKGVVSKKNSPIEEPIISKRKGKENTVWNKAAKGAEAEALDHNMKDKVQSKKELIKENKNNGVAFTDEELKQLENMKGLMKGNLADIQTNSDGDGESQDDIDDDEVENLSQENDFKSASDQTKPHASKGMFSMLRNWVGTPGGVMTEEQIDPIITKLKNHLIYKNVAVEVANELCDSVGKSLIGKKLGAFERISKKVQTAMEESCHRLLCCGRRVDVLRDVLEARKKKRPYVITFCGVNGVGKSTNLAKISFWLMEQGFRVMIAACDTFRSGAVEQLRVHVQRLNHIHPPNKHTGASMVHLYEKGYAKDAASVAFSAINAARDNQFDVVMVDTAGRMQDNEPLMRSLSKLISVNQPDLILFVGEALVGNEAVDQLIKFNKALQDYSQSDNPKTINGIVLSKFDIIDDKVGAAISMTHILGQPIMFVGTGQTYADLRKLSPGAVVKALMQ